MNFSAVKRLTFGKRPATTAGTPQPHTARQLARRYAQLAEAAAVVPHLPQPGEALHALMTGRYDLMHLIVVLIDQLPSVQHLRIATLAFSTRNVYELSELLDAGKVQGLTLLCSGFHRRQNPVEFKAAWTLCRRPGCRIAAPKNHCKVVCIEHADGKLVTEGSANLRTNDSQEQILIANDAALHDWHAAWIDAQVTTYAAEEEDGDEE